MLTTIEMALFFVSLAVSIYLTGKGIQKIISNVKTAQGSIDLVSVLSRLPNALLQTITLSRTFRARPVSTFFHALIAWGFLVFLLINANDLVYAFTEVRLLDSLGVIGGYYRTIADFFNVLILAGMAAMLARRFILSQSTFAPRQETGLTNTARQGIKRDSAIVGGFILLHNGARLLGESAFLARTVQGQDLFQPFASLLAKAIIGLPAPVLNAVEHISFWLSIGAILAFLPYFPISKHIHLFFAPVNFSLKPKPRALADLPTIDLEDENIETYGAESLADLQYGQILDAYACIMCFRCQDACPAYQSGKPLSPATLEINKRYALNQGALPTQTKLLDLIPEEAVWSCTSCGACVDICPVGNEPMIDILSIRRHLAMMESSFPRQMDTAFKGMERNHNPWNIPQAQRTKWAEGLIVPTVDENPEPDVLWWVGCAPATDPRAQKTARAFAEILNTAGVNFAILGRAESCTGDSARRAGREDIYYQLAAQNIEVINEVAPKLIVTTCPHCMHTIKNEYPDLGGHYQVVHHSQFINQLIGDGKIKLQHQAEQENVTFHDPCYLGRHNAITSPPRAIITASQANLHEMEKSGSQALCCGAGGAQFWKDEGGTGRNNLNRYQQAKDTGAAQVISACPFCLTMLSDAAAKEETPMPIMDIAEMVALNMVRISVQ